jgi:hypothetical protein
MSRGPHMREPRRRRRGGPAEKIARLPAPRLGEENDDYPTVAILNDRWRVVLCRNSIQWILQKRGGPNHYFRRTRDVLIRCAREHAGQIGGDALLILLRLPERFPG